MLKASRMILLVTETNVPSLWALERRLSALEGLGINPGQNSSRCQPLAQGRPGDAEQRSEKHQAPDYRIPSQ